MAFATTGLMFIIAGGFYLVNKCSTRLMKKLAVKADENVFMENLA
jgi:hypothetical protein